MAGRSLQDCPTCGRTFFHLALHVCAELPTIAAWLAVNLPNPKRAGYIISRTEYDLIPDKPIDSSALRRQFVSWNGLAQRYGLRCNSAHGRPNRARSDSAKTPLGAEILTELHRLSQELHDGRFGPSFNEYNTHAAAQITASGLRKRHGGSWAAVLDAAGLESAPRGDYIRGASERRAKIQQSAASTRGSFDRGDEPISREYTGIPVMPNPRRTPTGGLIWTVR